MVVYYCVIETNLYLIKRYTKKKLISIKIIKTYDRI